MSVRCLCTKERVRFLLFVLGILVITWILRKELLRFAECLVEKRVKENISFGEVD